MTDGNSLAVDKEGLLRVLSEWSGIGGLYSAVAAATPELSARDWSPEDIERRAMRILLLECSPLLRRWPRSARAWRDHLPTLSHRTRFWSESPQTRVDWSKTRGRGWPPETFAIRKRFRSSDQVTLSVLSWTLRRLTDAFVASQNLTGLNAAIADELTGDVEEIILQTLPVLDLLDESNSTTPSREDIRAVRDAGWPWNAVADVAQVFASLDNGGAEILAQKLLGPDGFPDSLFQLSILGLVLISAQNKGAHITSLRPIGHMTDGPVYRIQVAGEQPWELWCEGARCWEAYGLVDGYRELASNLETRRATPFQARNIRPDILLARPGDRALVLECKFPYETLDPGYVAHGLYQAAFYGHQLAPAFKEVTSFSIGPSELVPVHQERVLGGVTIGLIGPKAVHEIVGKLLFPAKPPI